MYLKNNNNKDASLHNIYIGRSAYLICGGPSINPANWNNHYDIPLEDFKKSINTKVTINNAGAIIRPNMTIMGDSVDKFLASFFLDTNIINFVSSSSMNKHIYSSTHKKKLMKASECPNVYGFKIASKFDANTFFNDEYCQWGNSARLGDVINNKISDRNKGSRSTFLIAVRLLYHLGFRRVFIIGADFNMDKLNPYGFSQAKSQGGVTANNNTYLALNDRLCQLQQYMTDRGYHLYNLNPKSKLTAVPHIPLSQAIAATEAELANIDIDNEPTANLYDKPRKGAIDTSLVPCGTILHDYYKGKPLDIDTDNSNDTIITQQKSNTTIVPHGTQGVIYYNQGIKCVEQLLLSIYSLRKYHHNIPITILNVGNTPTKLIEMQSTHLFDIEQMSRPDEQHILAPKVHINKYSPYERFLYLDSDTLIYRDISSIWDYTHDFCVTHFANHTTSSDLLKQRLNSLRAILPNISSSYDKDIPMTNTGVFLAKRNSDVFTKWQESSLKVDSFHRLLLDKSVKLLYDELILNCLIANGDIKPYFMSNYYNHSNTLGSMDNDNPYIIHYHSRKSRDEIAINYYEQIKGEYDEIH